jgi:hypothetical protein
MILILTIVTDVSLDKHNYSPSPIWNSDQTLHLVLAFELVVGLMITQILNPNANQRLNSIPKLNANSSPKPIPNTNHKKFSPYRRVLILDQYSMLLIILYIL